MKSGVLKLFPEILITAISLGGFFGFQAFAEGTADREEILQLQDIVEEKKTRLSELQSQIQTYQRKISDEQRKQITLDNQIALLENRIAKSELDIEANQVEIDSVNIEINLLDREIEDLQDKIEKQRELLASLLREIKNNDDRGTLEALLAVERFSDLYSQIKYLEDVQNDLQETLEEVRIAKADEEIKRSQKEEYRISLENLRKELEKNKEKLENERGTKEYLLVNAAASENRFQQLLRDLRAESQFIDNQVSALEQEMQDKLRQYDIDASDSSLFSWPLENPGIITTYFHDPDYPFRYLFEHSGLDMAIPKGTPVKTAAPGIVATSGTGRLYGNYVVIIHANGKSTLYAHLSRKMVRAEQFVNRGEVIGFSGGVRGEQGAGLSTGPHLHFEVRSNGIPVDPLDYLISL